LQVLIIEKSRIGTISNTESDSEIRISDVNSNKSRLVSCMSYNTKEFNIDSLIEVEVKQNCIVLSLKNKSDQLYEIIINNCYLKS